jgi:hypothetical protein
MKTFFRSALNPLLAVTLIALVICVPSLAQQLSANQPPSQTPGPLITRPVDEAQLTVLKGNTHPLARPEFDLGTAPATLPMQRMLLVLKRSPEQESALRKLLDDQQDKSSPSYHKWLTPDEFGKQFGPTDTDLQTITAWLQSHGFQVGTTKGRTVLEFSGSASQVKEAFHTTIHKYIVNEEQHWANSSDPSIPLALMPAVAGVLTLHNFLKKPQVHYSKQPIAGKIRPGKKPSFTFSDGTHGLGPNDYAVIYNSPAFNGGVTGNGVSVGVVGRSNLFNFGQDLNDFGNIFLCCGRFQVILDGPDPGDLGGGEEVEATLDTTWVGAVAPGAIANLIVSATTNTTDGADLSEVYIIESDLFPIMTESFSGCEADTTSTNAAGISALAEQAAAQGITYFVAAGDNGAEGCDDPSTETVASGPLSVNVLASTAFNVAVGGTVFNENGQTSTYWSTTNSGNFESAISYIPEDVWNDSCLASSCGSNANIVAGSGGESVYVLKPTWQSGVTGIPSSAFRGLPDVSLTAALHDPYLVCLDGSCSPNSQGEFFIYFVGGTSASSPSFAGVMSMIEQQNGQWQGQANYVLYRLAATENSTLSQCNGSSTTGLPASTCIFNDITIGNNAVPGEANYGQSSADYQAGVGYDLATGLGSVNITNLINQWNTVTFNPTTTTLSLQPTTSIVHGSPVTVNVTVSPNSGTATPTGDVALYSPVNPNLGFGFFTLVGGAVTNGSLSDLPGGSYSVFARYAGDAIYAPSSSQLGVSVTPEPSTTTESVLSFDANSNQFNFTNGPYGSFVYLRADVAGKSGFGVPTGYVTFDDNGSPLVAGSSLPLNSQGNTATPNGILNFDTGTHTISASYFGDPSFNASSTTTSQTFTITAGFYPTNPSPSTVIISAPGGSGQASFSVSSSTGFSGTITLSCSGLPSGAACQFSPSSVTAAGSPTTTPATITVTTMPPGVAMLQSPQHSHRSSWLALAGFTLFSVVLIGTSGKRRSFQFLLATLAFIMFAPGCASGGGSHPPPPNPGTPVGTYTVAITATSGSTKSSTGFTLVVQ